MKTKILKIAGTLFVIWMLLLAVLVWHLVDVMKPMPNSNAQMAKIEFIGDQTQLHHQMVQDLKQVKGVKQVKPFLKQKSLVFTYDNNLTNSEQIKQSLSSDYQDSYKWEIPENLPNASACPVINRDSWKYRMAIIVQKIFY